MYLPIAQKTTNIEKKFLYQYGYLFEKIIYNENINPLTICFLGPANSGKTTLLNFIKELNNTTQNDTYIVIKYNSWDYFNANNLWISIMYKLFKFVREDKDIGFISFYWHKFIYEFRFIRFIILFTIQIFIYIILNFFVITNFIVNIGVVSIISTSFMYIVFFLYESSMIGLNIFKKENYKNNFTIGRIIQYDINNFLTKLLNKKGKKIICLLDDIDKTSKSKCNELFEFMTMIKDTGLPIIICYAFDLEITIQLIEHNNIRNDIITFVDNHMDIILHIPLIYPIKDECLFKKDLEFFNSKTIFEKVKSILHYTHNNIPILYENEICLIENIRDLFFSLYKKYKFLIIPKNEILFLNDFFINYKTIHSLYVTSMLYTKKKLNLKLLDLNNDSENIEYMFQKNPNLFSNLNDDEKYAFQRCASFFGSDITKQKKCIILYKLSKLLYKESTDVLYLICFFEVWPCRMVILYFLMYTEFILEKEKRYLHEYISTVETYIYGKYTYKITLDINKRDFPKDFFRLYLTEFKIESKQLIKLAQYILNINYSLKYNLESYL